MNAREARQISDCHIKNTSDEFKRLVEGIEDQAGKGVYSYLFTTSDPTIDPLCLRLGYRIEPLSEKGLDALGRPIVTYKVSW